MHKRRTVIVLEMTMLAMLALAGPAFAGGQPDPGPAPGWLGIVVVVALLVAGAFSVSVIASGFVQRRRRR